jgi:hypothetical protein
MGQDDNQQRLQETKNMTKRSVSTDALETLGTIIGPDEKRDAIHLAVLPVVAGQSGLVAGESINVIDGLAFAADAESFGIVDPFLTETVREGQRFWMVLRPRLVTSLRHVWSHPAFPEEGNAAAPESKLQSDAMAKIERIAEDCDGLSAEQLIAAANRWLDHGDYFSQGGRFEGTWLPDEFWPLFEEVTGRKVADGKRESFFSCSC